MALKNEAASPPSLIEINSSPLFLEQNEQLHVFVHTGHKKPALCSSKVTSGYLNPRPKISVNADEEQGNKEGSLRKSSKERDQMDLPVEDASIAEALSANTALEYVGTEHLGSRGFISALMTV